MNSLEYVDLETKSKLIKLCADYLSESWAEVDEKDIVCKLMSAGISNTTYYCSIENFKIATKHENSEMKEVIIHMYGSGLFGKGTVTKFSGEAAEAVIQQILSEIGMAPKLYAVFGGGRIEEYIASTIATPDDLNSLELSKAIMRKLAKIHTLKLPISKQTNFVEKIVGMMQGSGAADMQKLSQMYNENEILKIQNIFNFPLAEEVLWIAQIIPRISHRFIFSQNDMNNNNILLKKQYTSVDDRIMIIDYEMCHYYYRGYDLAYFLRMKKSRLRFEGEKLFLTEDEADDENTTNELFKEYLNAFESLNQKMDPKYDTVEHLRMETEICNLLYECMIIGYTLVAMANAPCALDYSESLANGYAAKKSAMLKKYGNKVERCE